MADENNQQGQQGQEGQQGLQGQQSSPNSMTGQAPSWRDALGPDYKDHVGLKSYATLDDFAKSHLEAQRMVGADKVAIPGKDAKPEEWDNYFKKLGRPDNADGYGLKLPDNLPPGVSIDAEGLKAIAAAAHKLGVPKTQMEGLFNEVMTLQTKQAEELSKEFYLDPAVSEAKMKEVFGQAFDQRLAEVQQFLAPMFEKMPWVREYLDKTGLTNSAPLVVLFAEAAAATRESGQPQNGKPAGKVTPNEAQAELDALKMDKNFMDAWQDKQNPGHAAAVKRFAELAGMTESNVQVLFDAADYFGKPTTIK